MKNKGYYLTDWIFFFSKQNQDDLQNILDGGGDENVVGELITYKLITVFLPVVPYLIVLVLNVLMNIKDSPAWFSFLNNGSMPIISFGIISAGMPYLLEQLQQFPNYHIIRRRVMAVSLIFLFLTAALYIFQTVAGLKFNTLTNVASLVLSFYIFFFSASIGYKMFLLQSKNIETYGERIQGDVDGLQGALDDM